MRKPNHQLELLIGMVYCRPGDNQHAPLCCPFGNIWFLFERLLVALAQAGACVSKMEEHRLHIITSPEPGNNLLIRVACQGGSGYLATFAYQDIWLRTPK